MSRKKSKASFAQLETLKNSLLGSRLHSNVCPQPNKSGKLFWVLENAYLNADSYV